MPSDSILTDRSLRTRRDGSLALILDVGEVLLRHGYPAPAGATLVELTAGIYRALHPHTYLPPPTFPP